MTQWYNFLCSISVNKLWPQSESCVAMAPVRTRKVTDNWKLTKRRVKMKICRNLLVTLSPACFPRALVFFFLSSLVFFLLALPSFLPSFLQSARAPSLTVARFCSHYKLTFIIFRSLPHTFFRSKNVSPRSKCCSIFYLLHKSAIAWNSQLHLDSLNLSFSPFPSQNKTKQLSVLFCGYIAPLPFIRGQ